MAGRLPPSHFGSVRRRHDSAVDLPRAVRFSFPSAASDGVSSSGDAMPPHDNSDHDADGTVLAPTRDWLLPPAASPEAHATVERLRRLLQFFFMCPVNKWRARRQFPFKLTLQLVKVVLVTVQLCLFASRRFSFVGYVTGTQVVLEHLLVPDWDPVREVNAYPPNSGPLAVYSQKQFFDTLDYAVNNYYSIDEQTLGDISFPNGTESVTRLCVDEYAGAKRSPDRHRTLSLAKPVSVWCLDLVPSPAELRSHNFSTRLYLERRGVRLPFVTMSQTRLSMALVGVRLKLCSSLDVPQCYLLNVTLVLDNSNLDGQMYMKLVLDPRGVACFREIHTHSVIRHPSRPVQVMFTLLNALVIVVCSVSFYMCARSIVRALRLRCHANQVLMQYFGYMLNSAEHRRFIQLWYLCILVNDALIVFASVLKIRLDFQLSEMSVGSFTWNLCSVALGVGTLLVWLGLLRYFSFFHSYNVLILTVKNSMPGVLRFSVCAGICYVGFALCGWMVLSPYHMKFRTLSETSEALFSLMNGDDMFATFAQVSRHSPLVYWFSKLYIYVFVFAFIYLVLSLMISIIMDTFDTIKTYYQKGFPQTPLDGFCAARVYGLESGAYLLDDPPNLLSRVCTRMCCCCLQSSTLPSAEYTAPIIGSINT